MNNVTKMEEPDALSMCSLYAGERMFGMDTRSVREVLGQRRPQAVPLAPPYIGGIVPYHGDVLTAVSFRSLLGMPPAEREGCVLVFDGDEEGERFGLMVDRVGGVVTVERRMYAPNPPTLDPCGQALFDGAYRLPNGLLVQLDPERLRPGRLAASGLFSSARADSRAGEGSMQCGL